jgi:hypothetical protein
MTDMTPSSALTGCRHTGQAPKRGATWCNAQLRRGATCCGAGFLEEARRLSAARDRKEGDMLSAQAKVILAIALFTGGAAGVLTYLATRSVPQAVLAAGAASSGLVQLIGQVTGTGPRTVNQDSGRQAQRTSLQRRAARELRISRSRIRVATGSSPAGILAVTSPPPGFPGSQKVLAGERRSLVHHVAPGVPGCQMDTKDLGELPAADALGIACEALRRRPCWSAVAWPGSSGRSHSLRRHHPCVSQDLLPQLPRGRPLPCSWPGSSNGNRVILSP